MKAIIVKLTIEGVHKWDTCDLPQVHYLKELHRHTFYIKCIKEVSHNNRDIEIIDFKRQIVDYLNDTFYDAHLKLCNFQNNSCEDICEILCNKFQLNLCEVLEDNENGAVLLKH